LASEFLGSKVEKQLDKTIVVDDRQTIVVVKCKRSDWSTRVVMILYDTDHRFVLVRTFRQLADRFVRKRAWNVGEEKKLKTTISSHNATSERQKQWKRSGKIIFFYTLLLCTVSVKQVFFRSHPDKRVTRSFVLFQLGSFVINA